MGKIERLKEAIWAHRNREFDGLVVSDLAEIPERYRGEVLHINDHGNITLYRAFKNGNVHEIASCV